MRGYAIIRQDKTGNRWIIYMGSIRRLADMYVDALRKSNPHQKFVVVEYREVRRGGNG